MASSHGELVNALLNGTLNPPVHECVHPTDEEKDKSVHNVSKSVSTDLKLPEEIVPIGAQQYKDLARDYLLAPENLGKFTDLRVPQWAPSVVIYSEQGSVLVGWEDLVRPVMLILNKGEFRGMDTGPGFQEMAEHPLVFTTTPKNRVTRPRMTKKQKGNSGTAIDVQIQQSTGRPFPRHLIPDMAFSHSTTKASILNVDLSRKKNPEDFRFYSLLEFKKKFLLQTDDFRRIFAGQQPVPPKGKRKREDDRTDERGHLPDSRDFIVVLKQGTAYCLATMQRFVAVYDAEILYLFVFVDMQIQNTPEEQWEVGPGRRCEFTMVDTKNEQAMTNLGFHIRSIKEYVDAARKANTN